MVDAVDINAVDLANRQENRRFHRVEIPKAFVHCSCDFGVAYYELGDLSAGGAGLRGKRALSPGAPVEVILFLPQWDTTSFTGQVRRVRHDHGSARYLIGVEFDALSPELEGRLVRLIQREIRITRGPLALWASQDGVRDDTISAALKRAGFSVVGETSPLGLLTRLEDPSLPVEMVVVQEGLGVMPLPELVRQLRRSHPRLKFYAVGSFEPDEWEALYPLVEAILEPGTAESPFTPLIS